MLARPGEAEQGLGRLFAQLEPGGTLVMSFMEVWREGEPLRRERLVGEAVRPEDGARIRHDEITDFEPESRIARTRNLYQVCVDEQLVASDRHDDVLGWYSQEEIRSLHERAGFEEVRIVSGFSWQPAGPEDRVFCCLARRPQAG